MPVAVPRPSIKTIPSKFIDKTLVQDSLHLTGWRQTSQAQRGSHLNPPPGRECSPRSCTARAKGWKTEAKKNILSRNQPDLLQAILPQHTWQAKGSIFTPNANPFDLCLPSPQPLEMSFCSPHFFSPNFCQILFRKRQEGAELRLQVLADPVSRPQRVPLPPPLDLHPSGCPTRSNSITSHQHSCLPMAHALGWVPVAGQLLSSASCSLKRAAGVQQLPTSSFT